MHWPISRHWSSFCMSLFSTGVQVHFQNNDTLWSSNIDHYLPLEYSLIVVWKNPNNNVNRTWLHFLFIIFCIFVRRWLSVNVINVIVEGSKSQQITIFTTWIVQMKNGKNKLDMIHICCMALHVGQPDTLIPVTELSWVALIVQPWFKFCTG